MWALSSQILDALGLGLRLSPVFVGQATLRENLVHYVAPPFAQAPHILDGLSTFEAVTRGAEPLVRAAVIAFGFVYIHPMRDGNGRLHRFLIKQQCFPTKTESNSTVVAFNIRILLRASRLNKVQLKILLAAQTPSFPLMSWRIEFGKPRHSIIWSSTQITRSAGS